MHDDELEELDPVRNPLIPGGTAAEDAELDGEPFNELVEEWEELDPAALEAQLETTNAPEGDIGGGLRLERSSRISGALLFKNGILIQDIRTLTVGDLRRLRRALGRS